MLVAIPALNEEASLPGVIAELRGVGVDLDVLVVDDGSGDNTAEVARVAGAMVCSLPFNLGVGGAMRAAFKYAVRHDYDVVVQVDADGQHDPRFVVSLLDALCDADVVVGARFAGVGDYRVAAPRRLAMRVLSVVLSRLSGRPLTDVTSGFRATNRRGIRLFAVHYPAEYLGDTVESLVIALRTGCVITQVPVDMRQRHGGSASQSSTRALMYLARAGVALVLALVRSWPYPDLDPPIDPEGV